MGLGKWHARCHVQPMRTLLLLSPLALAACSDEAPPNAASLTPQDVFWESLSTHCGQAYAGKLVSEDAVDADFRGAAMVMHVKDCSETEIAVPFHVQRADGSWDRSRTWRFTRVETGLRLKHDHRHEDGKPDAVTMYGGDTNSLGTARIQGFPVDQESIAMFKREGLGASVTNVWTVEVDAIGSEEGRFAYQLERTELTGAPEDRFFRVEFDLGRPVETPPAPWGQE